MAESGLSLGWSDFKKEVGWFMGYGRDPTAWSEDQTSEIESIVQSGVRRVYYPVSQTPGIAGYEWSWLRPTSIIYLGASGSDGTITGDQFDSATYTNWVTQGITTDDTVTISAVGSGDTPLDEYTISSVAIGAITLGSSPGDGSSLTFLVGRSPANYSLPDDFGRLIGELHFKPDDQYAAVKVCSVADMLEMRAIEDRTGAPAFAAVRPKAWDRTTGQRWEILFWPRPDTSYTLYCEYEAYSGALSDSYPYPLGGMELAELYIESCLAVAEQRFNDEVGLHTQAYQAFLTDAVTRDRKRSARYYGRMGQPKTHRERRARGDTGGTYPITYSGELI